MVCVVLSTRKTAKTYTKSVYKISGFFYFKKTNTFLCISWDFGGIFYDFAEFGKMGWENRDFPENTLNLTPMG